MTPRVSLLIPNRNNEPALELVFEKLAEHTTYPDFEVVVVDDGSDDRSREILQRWHDSGRFERFVVHEQPPSGVVVALNKGLELATGEIIVQLDADATVETPGWLGRMVEFFSSDDGIGVVSPRIVFDTGFVHAYGVNIVVPEGLHDRGTQITEDVGRRTLHQNVKRFKEAQVPYGSDAVQVDTGIGCCMMYRKADALAVGGYDMGFQPVWFDDLDLALSIRHKLSKSNYFLPSAHVIHHVTLRHTREAPPTPRERVEARIGQIMPARVKARVIARTGVGGGRPEHMERLRRHYAYWREKWGWDLLNPDMAEVRRRYDGSQLLWRES